MQTLSKLSVYNFKSCKKLEDVELADFAPLVGYNNAGKSNLLAALQWILKPTVLSASAFFDPAAPVRVEARIDGVSQTVIDSLGDTHKPRITPFIKDGVIHIRREQPKPDGSKSDIKLRVRDPSKPDNDANAWKENPTGIPAAIEALFPEPITIGAMEDAGKDVGKFETGSTIGKLISKLMASVKETQGQAISDRLNELHKLLAADGPDRAPELKAFDETANKIVADFFPGIQVKVHVPAPEISAVFKAGTIRVYESHGVGAVDPTGRDVSAFGHGAQRAIQMALVRQLAEATGPAQGGRTLLLVDEPELYMHPQAVAKVRSALKKLSSGAYQVVFTTHSPLMIGRDDLSAVLVLCKHDGTGTSKRKRLGQAVTVLEQGSPAQLDELFSVEGANQVLFSDRVILAEGKTERELVPDLFEACHGVSPADRRIGFVPVEGSGNIDKCLKVLAQMGIPARAVVDLDFAFRQAAKCKLIDPSDSDVATCKALCAGIASANGGTVGGDGFFEKANKEVCFEKLAADPGATAAIQSLHNKLKAKGIWLWTGGAIEFHLGLAGKDHDAWRAMRKSLRAKGIPAAKDHATVGGCMKWLAGD